MKLDVVCMREVRICIEGCVCACVSLVTLEAFLYREARHGSSPPPHHNNPPWLPKHASICTDSTATKLSSAVLESVQRDALDLFMIWNCVIYDSR